MKPRLRLSRRSRLRLALLVACALLLQQLALAAYACTLDVAPAHATMGASSEMPMPAASGGDAALCAYHCADHTSVTPDARAPTVPPAMLPALVPSASALAPAAFVPLPASLRTAPRPPPLPATLLFCTLLI
ncbi:MAG TPA: hypothetical protein VF216_05010 [Mizugakiibacter sp.]